MLRDHIPSLIVLGTDGMFVTHFEIGHYPQGTTGSWLADNLHSDKEVSSGRQVTARSSEHDKGSPKR